MLSHYQEASKIVNITVLDLLLFYKRKLIYRTTVYHKEIQDQVLGTNKSSREKPFITPVISAAEY